MLRFPEDVRAWCARRYATQRRDWLAGAGTWPLSIGLGSPTEADTQAQTSGVREWVSAWTQWQGQGTLTWRERRWPTLGAQRLPERLLLATPADVASWIGEAQRWQRALARSERLRMRWPALSPCLPRYYDEWAGYSDQDMLRVEALLSWIEANPRSNLYPRQLPIAGMDTKWLEARLGVVADLAGALRTDMIEQSGFYQRCGLRTPPPIVRVRLLDQSLRDRVGGLCDIAAPLEEIASLRLPVARAYIVENTQSGLCFSDVPGAVVFMGLGYGVGLLGPVSWLAGAECVYWGDLDTHGFAILNAARTYLPHVVSALMDEETLLRYRDLWVEERDQTSATELPLLTEAEQAVFRGLKTNRWGLNVRLEQERLAWDLAWRALTEGS